MQKMLAIMFCNLNPANIRPICAQNAFSSIYHDIARRMQFPRNFRLTVFQHTLVDCKACSVVYLCQIKDRRNMYEYRDEFQ